MRLKVVMACAVVMFFSIAATAQIPKDCKQVAMVKPTPFLGTANEIIVLSDGSIWEDLSYKYLYLYLYNPTVVICPARGKMYIPRAGDEVIEFTVQKIK
jgi:hypothetical protein